MRKKKLAKNTIASFMFQITTIVCGFILPRLILRSFGSEVNGLINSITQFLHVIAFLELGVGAVVQSSLYKPLADEDNRKVSQIIVSANKFFQKLAMILLAYIIVLFFVYPMIAKQDFGFLYTALLIAAMSISSFAQYYFGVVDRLLLTADQRGYIQYTAQTITLILNTLACFVLIKRGASIHMVKLTTSLIYLARPLFLHWYVNHNYHINRRIKYDKEPIEQKWNGVAQHVAAVVLDGTDNIVLTIFASMSAVSIYSVYNLVLAGVKQLFLSMTNGFQSLIGELWAKQELEELRKTFGWTEWVLHTGTVFVFGCTGVLILPFVRVYTNGINDANYVQPLFAFLITLANAGHCLRLPYNIMILAAGHYKQTQRNYIVAAVVNIVISVVMVWRFGLVGVAIGTLAAILYQTVWMAVYDSRNLIKWPVRNFIKQVSVDVMCVFVGVLCTFKLGLHRVNYFSWVILSIEVAFIWLVTMGIINTIFYRDRMKKIFNTSVRILSRKSA